MCMVWVVIHRMVKIFQVSPALEMESEDEANTWLRAKLTIKPSITSKNQQRKHNQTLSL